MTEPIEGVAVKRDNQKLRPCNAVSDKNGTFEFQCEQPVPSNRQLQFRVATRSDLRVRNSRAWSVSQSDFSVDCDLPTKVEYPILTRRVSEGPILEE